MDVSKKVFHVNYRVSYKLSWTVISNIPSAVDMIIRGLYGMQMVLTDEQVILIATFSQCKHVRMLAKNKKVIGGFFLSGKVPVVQFYGQYFFKQPGLIVPR